MKKEEVIKWLTIMKADLNSFPEVSNAKKIEALGEAIRLLKNEQSIDKIDCEHTECRNCTNHKYCDYEISSSEKPNKSENPTGSTTKKCTTCAYREIDGKPHEMCKSCVCGNRYREDSTTKNDLDDCISRFSAKQVVRNHYCSIPSKVYNKLMVELDNLSPKHQ